jgi:putative DNA primase/helicase
MSSFPQIQTSPATLSNVLPKELLSLPRWLLWKAFPQSSGKPRKVPFYLSGRPRKGELGGPEDLQNLGSFHAVLDKYLSNSTKWAGLGFALIDGDGIGALDFDGCVKGGAIQADDPIVQNAIEEVRRLGAYLELSPSGNGLRAFGWTEGFENMTSPFEAYERDRYVTVTGKCLSGAQAWVNIDSVVNSVHPPQPPPPVVPNMKLPRQSPLSKAIGGIYPPLPETPMEIARIQDALSHISPYLGYEDWRDILCALHSTTWKVAEDIARVWSAGGNAQNPTCTWYNKEGFDDAWAKLKSDGGIGIGTLLHVAKQNGWKPPTLTLVSSNTSPPMQQTSTATHNAGASATSPPASGPPLSIVDPDSTGDIRNGQEFAALFNGKMLYIHEIRTLLEFGPNGWAKALPGRPSQAADEVVHDFQRRARLLAAAGHSDESSALMKHAKWSSMGSRLEQMVKKGCSHPSMYVPISELDKDPTLLGVGNGVVNLKTGLLEKVCPSILVTKRAGVDFDPNATAPEFQKFLAQVQPDPAVRHFLKQVAGLFLLGHVLEQRLFFFYGSGANGKSTFIELMNYVMGEYAHSFDINSLLKQSHASSGPTPELVAFRGMRLSHTSEIPLGAKIDEQRVKLLTGGDTICARGLYVDTINFKPSHSLVMVGNHLPEIRDVSDAMRRRLLLIGFNARISSSQQNPHLLTDLKAEGSGVLNWMLDGLKDYLVNDLMVPQSVSDASTEFMEAEDLLGQWLAECCNTGFGLSASRQTVYRSYDVWAEAGGHKKMSQHTLTRRLNERSINQDDGRRNYQGINLKSQDGGG